MKHILYLEDDEALAMVTCRALAKRGFSVDHAATLEAFSSLLATTTANHFLLDLKIGNETSLSLLKTIREKSNAPILILSGYGTIRVAVQAVKLGATDFLSKPCSIDDIVEAFEKDIDINHDETINEIEKPSLKAIEWEVIQKALDDNDGNVSAAARQLKMHRRTLQRKLKKKHINISE